jgi:hypothetical protein
MSEAGGKVIHKGLHDIRNEDSNPSGKLHDSREGRDGSW